MLKIYLLSLLLGIFAGSLINYIIYRIYGNLKGDFKCPNCKHKLKPNEVIPVISYLTTEGRCNYCNKPIPKKHPIIEIFTGLVFIFIAYNLNINFLGSGIDAIEIFKLISYWFITSYLIMVITFDIKWYIIPDKLTSAGLILTTLLLTIGTFILNIYTKEELGLRILTAFIIFLIFFTVYIFSSRKALDFSDVKLATFIALLFGWPNIIPTLIFTFLSGTIIGLTLVILKKKTLKSKVPFSPFLIIGTIITLIFGDGLIQWYLGL